MGYSEIIRLSHDLMFFTVLNTICAIFFFIFSIAAWKSKQRISILMTMFCFTCTCITTIIRQKTYITYMYMLEFL